MIQGPFRTPANRFEDDAPKYDAPKDDAPKDARSPLAAPPKHSPNIRLEPWRPDARSLVSNLQPKGPPMSDRKIVLEAAAARVVQAAQKLRAADAETREKLGMLGASFVGFCEEMARPVAPLLEGGSLVLEGLADMTRWYGGMVASATNAIVSAKAVLQAQHDEAGEPSVAETNEVLERMAARIVQPVDPAASRPN